MQARSLFIALIIAGSVRAAEEAPSSIADDAPPSIPREERSAAADVRQHADKCDNCGIVQTIRSFERERSDRRRIPNYMASEQYLGTRRYSEPHVGPVVGMTFGPGGETRTFVGAAGANTMRQSVLEIGYEITVRFDDGRMGTIEQDRTDGMHAGDRVRMVDNRLQLLPREPR
jgi:hypothetical protein